MNRLVVHEDARVSAEDQLARNAPLEDGCFMLLREAVGARGRRLIATDVLLPPEDGWEVQEHDQLRPSARWISSVISRAINAEAGLLFIHSHPDPDFPPGFSRVDESALVDLAKTIGPILDGPFAAAIVHPQGWVAKLASVTGFEEIDQVWASGRTLRLVSPTPIRVRQTTDAEVDARQRDALGVVHDIIRDLRIGVVGAGGLGSPMAEHVTRMGAAEVILVEHDVLDTPSNVRRVSGSTARDLNRTVPPPKVDVVGDHLDAIGLAGRIRRVNADVREERAFRELLDCDVVLCGTDTHGSRAVVNDLASAYLLPIIDVGVRAGSKKSGSLAALTAEVRVLTPVTPCLWCRCSISADVIRAENLPPEQQERLKREGYLPGGVGEPAPSIIALTALGASLATCALLAILSTEGEVAPSGFIVDGFLAYAMETEPLEPKPDCICRRKLGMADAGAPPFITPGSSVPGAVPVSQES